MSKLEWILSLASFGALSATVRYFYEIAEKGVKLSYKLLILRSYVSAFLAVLAGVACEYWGFDSVPLYLVVAGVAVMSREIMDKLPMVFDKVFKTTMGKYFGKDDKGDK